jgi:solute carrier family 25 phosphate transporter 3
MTPTIHYSSIQKSNPRVDMTKVEECNDDERNTSMIAMSRRKALLASFAMASSAILVSPSASTAKSMDDFAYKIPSLVDINLGQGEWLHLSEQTGSSSLSTSMIQPNFATYATRFLINYDDGVAQWWKDVKYQNSLVSASEERNNLGKSFGSLTRSIQISLDHFCTGEAISTLDIQQKMEQLFKVFYESYVIQPDGTKNEEAGRQLGILFSILAVKYQPLNGMKNILYIKEKPTDKPAVPNSPQSPDKISIAFTEELTNLLPSRYQSYYDPSSKSYKIQPEVPLYEIGIENEFGQNAIATPFGPLSSVPLQRREPNLSSGLYALLGMSGALACVVTHSLVIPFDVVKTRLQTDPERYSNIIEGTMSIAENEGIQGFTLGAEATIAGYFWYGLSVYPSYTFSKWYLSHELLTPAYATAHASAIALAAGAIAAVIASIGLAPLEACRIRTVAEPEVYRDIGLKGTLQVVAEEDTTLGWKKLYAGLPSLMIRQVIFGSVKFIAFEKASENIFITWPSLRDATVTALGVTLVAGALSGALSSVVSQPADSVLTYVAKSKGDNGSLLSIVNKMVEDEGAGSLFRGLGSRCIWATAIISGQFFLYDIFRTALGINNDDLSQVFEFVVNTIN